MRKHRMHILEASVESVLIASLKVQGKLRAAEPPKKGSALKEEIKAILAKITDYMSRLRAHIQYKHK